MTTFALVGASDFNAAHFEARCRGGAFDAVIAVDGGFSSLETIGVRPDLALGDFDSLGFLPSGVEVRAFLPEKDASDMELALEEAVRRDASAVTVYGALGRRLDHTLANLQLFASFAERGLAVSTVGEEACVEFLVGPGELSLDGVAGGIVSVFSLTDESRGVTEEDLKWELDAVTMTSRTSWGLSNELTGRPARIAVESGTLAVFCPLESAVARGEGL
ncbi:MAG: thiamine diphosphokinase [Adlercreutzia sp.]|nr:thiamine diphosphokinase [Adlercreutzia sp.]